MLRPMKQKLDQQTKKQQQLVVYVLRRPIVKEVNRLLTCITVASRNAYEEMRGSVFYLTGEVLVDQSQHLQYTQNGRVMNE